MTEETAVSEETETAVRAVLETRDGRSGGFGQDKDRDSRSTGNRDSRRGNGRDAGRSSSFDSPIQTKPSSTRQTNKNAHKNDRFDKRDREEDGKKAPKTGKGAFHYAAA